MLTYPAHGVKYQISLVFTVAKNAGGEGGILLSFRRRLWTFVDVRVLPVL